MAVHAGSFSLKETINPRLDSPILLFCDAKNKQFVVGAEEGIIKSISTKNYKTTKIIKTNGNPVVFIPSGNHENLYVCEWIGSPLVNINLKTFSVERLRDTPGMFPPPFPLGCALDSAHNVLYSADFLRGCISVFDVS